MRDQLDITFRPCRPDDGHEAVPLIYSSGPAVFDYVFSDRAQTQSTEFLKSAFVRGPSEFGYQQHTAAILDGAVVGVGAVRFARQNLGFTMAAVRDIVHFYNPVAALRTIRRGLRLEKVLRPPAPGVGIIYQLGVAPAMRGRGIGSRLISELLDQIQQDNIEVAALDVAITNDGAKALYERLGFAERTSRRSQLQSRFGHVVDHIYMERPLS